MRSRALFSTIIISVMLTLLSNLFGYSNNILSEPKIFPYEVKLKDIDGNLINFENFRGKYIMIVNVASNCGFTGQYEDLENLYKKYKEKLVIIACPSNQFGNQEPGNNSQIKEFCQRNYGVSFIISEKIEVKGENKHQIYKWLTNKDLNGRLSSEVKWNFQKYLINTDGNLIDFYYSTTKPNNKKILNHLK